MKKLIRFIFALFVVLLLPFIYIAAAISWAFDQNMDPFPIKSLIHSLTFELFFKGEA